MTTSILMLTYEFPTDHTEAAVSGEVKNPYLLADALSKSGVTVDIVNVPFLSRDIRARTSTPSVRNIWDAREGRGVAILRYAWRVLNVYRLLRTIDVEKYDAVHAQAPPLALATWLASLRANGGRRRPRIVVTGHGTNLPEADADAKVSLRQRARVINARLVLPIDRAGFRVADLVVSVSEFQRRELAEIYRVPRDRVQVIHNGVDLDRYHPPAEGTSSPNAMDILFVGRLVPKKGVQHLLRAMPSILERNGNARLTIVGGSPIFDSYGPTLRRLCRDLGLDPFVTWLSEVPEVELPTVYQRASVGVFPSEGYESLPTVILEAMACGLPVVATRSWGTPEALGSDHPGLMPEPSPEAIIAAVERVCTNPAVWVNVQERQLQHVRKFSLDATRRAHMEAYRDGS